MKTRAKGSSGRLTGRLVIFVWAALLLGAVGVKAAPVKTVVQDTLYRADGNAAQGDITIRWPGFSTSAGEAVAAGQMTVKTDANGGISIPLIPNTGSSPSGSYYRVVIKLDDGTTSEEMWVVPAVATTTVSAIRAKVVPQAVAAQFASQDTVDTALAQVVHLAGTETIQGAKTFVPSPQVPVPSVAGGAANKGYVDQAIAGLATVASTGNYNDLSNKPAGASLASPGAIGAITPGPVNATVYTVNGAPLASANLSDGTLLARTSTTINGFPISSNVNLSASNLTMGALPDGTTATTQAVNDNSAKLATTQYVASSLASPGSIGATTPGPLNATAITASNSVAVGTTTTTTINSTGVTFPDSTTQNTAAIPLAQSVTCPTAYGAAGLCSKIVNGMVNGIAYGMDPTATNPSCTGLQAAAAAAVATEPGAYPNTVFIPAGDYIINECDLTAYTAVKLVGANSQVATRFFYTGTGGPAAIGTSSYMLKLGNTLWGGFVHIRFFGVNLSYATSVTSMAQNAVVFTGAPDSGSTYDDFNFVGYFGDAMVLTKGATNFYASHFRADELGGYLFNVTGNNSNSGNPISLRDFTVDNYITGTPIATFRAANPYTTGAVATVLIATAGSGMSPDGTYLVPATGTSLAVANAQIVISGGAMVSATVLGEGSGYTSAPTFNLANAQHLYSGAVSLGGTLGTLTATLGTISSTQNGKGILFASKAQGQTFYMEHIRMEHNQADVNIGNYDEGTVYFNDDYSQSKPAIGWRDFSEVGNSASRHPIISTAQGAAVPTLLGPNGYAYISSIYKNRSTQAEYGTQFESNASYWSFGKNPVQFQGTTTEGQQFDVTPSGSITTNTQPRTYGDWIYRRSDFVPGTNGPVRIVTSPTSGRGITATGGALNISTVATIAANGSNANITGFNPLAVTGTLRLGDQLVLLNSGAGGSGSATVTISCIDGTGSGTACAGLGAQGLVTTAPACLPSSCPSAGALTVQWTPAVLGDFGFEAAWGSAAPSSGTYTKGRVVWNTNIASGQPIYWMCSVAGTPGTWIAGPIYGSSGVASVVVGANTPATGAVTFAGPNVSQSGNTFTFSGGGGTRVGGGFCTGTFSSSSTYWVTGLGSWQSGGACPSSGNYNESTFMMPTGGTLSNLTVRCATTGVNAASGVFTIMDEPVNSGSSASTGITVTYGTTTANHIVQDTTDTYNYSAGDVILVKFTTYTTGETLANCGVSFNY